VVVRCALRRALLAVLLSALPHGLVHGLLHGLLHGLPRVPMHLRRRLADLTGFILNDQSI
jgi:hypothetical protein